MAIEPTDAWHTGTNVQTAMRHSPQATFAALTALLMDAVGYLDMNKTLRNEDDVIHAVNHLVKQFPVMKLEEWKVICDRLKTGHYGKMFERLKLPELVDVFTAYEGERAEMMEREHQQDKTVRLQDLDAQTFTRLKNDLNLPDAPSKHGRWDWITYPNDDDANETTETD